MTDAESSRAPEPPAPGRGDRAPSVGLYADGPSVTHGGLPAGSGEIAWSQPGFGDEPMRAYASTLVLGKNLLVLTDLGELLKKYEQGGACRLRIATRTRHLATVFEEGKLDVLKAKNVQRDELG